MDRLQAIRLFYADMITANAGIPPGSELQAAFASTSREKFVGDAPWKIFTRSGYVDRQRIGGRRLICGHTPVSRAMLEDSLKYNKIMLDNGCVFGGLPEMGSLAALDLESMKVYYQENIDR